MMFALCPCLAGVAQMVDSNKRAMSLASAVLLITVPWMQISRVAASGVSVSPAALAAVVAAVSCCPKPETTLKPSFVRNISAYRMLYADLLSTRIDTFRSVT